MQGKISTDEAADKLSAGITGAPDKVADFVDKLAGSSKQAHKSAGQTAQKGNSGSDEKA